MREKLIKEGLSTKNPALQRLMMFLESKGKPSTIAKNIGRSPNIFSVMIDRDTEPSLGILRDLAKEFPDMDLNQISLGIVSRRQRELEEEVKKKDEEILYQRAIVTKFAMPGKTKGATISPGATNEIPMILRNKDGKRRLLLSPSCVPRLYLR